MLRGRENMLGLHLNPNKRRLTLAWSVHVYTNERTTDRVSGDPLVWVRPLKPLTLLRGRDGAEWNARSRKRENVSPPDIHTQSKSGQGKRQAIHKKFTFFWSTAFEFCVDDDEESMKVLLRDRVKHRGAAINILMCWADAAVFALFSSWDCRIWFWASLHHSYMHETDRLSCRQINKQTRL